jgi:hypothetical protein
LIAPSDFQLESFRIDEQIWDALGLRSGDHVLFLGLANDGAWVRRALEVGVRVTVIGGDDATVARIGKLGATAIRGSATMVPAETDAYDAAISFHYLHEIDPGFHAQVIAELARVGRRVTIVEPSPPADPLGRRIAALYSRAKREAGLFEQYQPLEYWRKLLAMVKADVYQSLFTFTRVPPRHQVAETVALVLQAMAIEEMPQEYLDELRTLAARPDAQLLPLSRIVLIGTAADDPPPQGTPTKFRPGIDLAPPPPRPTEPLAIATPAPAPRPVIPPAQPQPGFGFGFTSEPEPPELPPPPPPPAAAKPPPAAAMAPPAPPEPDFPEAHAAPFGAPFALPEDEQPFGGGDAGTPPAAGFGWAWEPPEGEQPN